MGKKIKMNNSVIIYYFSGCGNGKWVAQKTAEDFSQKGCNVEVLNIEEHNEYVAAGLVGFVFPVYGFGLPTNCVEFLKNYQANPNQNVFIITTAAGLEGISLLQARNILKSKNCNVIHEDVVFMLDTWIFCGHKSTPLEDSEILKEAQKNIHKLVVETLDNKKSISKITIKNGLMYLFTGLIYLWRRYFGRRFFGKMFTVNEKCNGCGHCKEICAGKGITIKNGRPVWSWKCLQCFRCFHLCPQNAVEISGWGFSALILTLLLAWHLYTYYMPDVVQTKLFALSLIMQIIFWLYIPFVVLGAINFLNDRALLPKWFFAKRGRRIKQEIFEEQKKL